MKRVNFVIIPIVSGLASVLFLVGNVKIEDVIAFLT